MSDEKDTAHEDADEVVDASFDDDEPVEKVEEPSEDPSTPTQLGSTRYVHAAFFGAGILCAYLAGKMINAIWSSLADWPAAVRAVPQLQRYAEEDRGSITLLVGAVVGIGLIAHTYRKPHVRSWASEVAGELSKVTWPDKEMVTNSTIVVVIASAVAMVYIALLDRFWGFITTLVYGV